MLDCRAGRLYYNDPIIDPLVKSQKIPPFVNFNRKIALPSFFASLGTGLAMTVVDFFTRRSIMLRFGQLSADEYFVSEAAAKAGITIANNSRVEPMVILKHFGPNHPDMPKSVPDQNGEC